MLLRGTVGKDILKGGVDADTLYGFEGDDILSGGGADDVIAGHAGADTLNGDAGDDWLIGGLGDDVVNGGAGIDWASYEDATSSVTVDLLVTTAQNTGGAGLDRLIAIENLYGSLHDDLLKGNNVANILNGGMADDALFGRGGNDFLYGGEGYDWLEGGLGNDLIDGGSGEDWAAYEEATKGVTVNLGIVGAQNTIGAGIDTLVDIERLYGSAFSDKLTASANGDGLYGGVGDDLLTGGAGDDVIHGGLGNDKMDGGAGIDTLTFDGGAQGVFVDLARAAITGGAWDTGAGLDSFVNFENVVGTDHSDWLAGNDAANILSGGAGDDFLSSRGSGDTLDGGAGDDHLTGTVGANKYIGGEGSDTFVVPYAGAGATIDLSRTGAQGIAPGITVTLSSIENLWLGMGNNTVWFNTSANEIQGGSGADAYIYRSLAEIGKGVTADHILDWTKADKIDVSKIDANTKIAGDQAFVWATQFTKQAGQVIQTWDSVTQISHVQFDINGDGKADAELFLHGAQANAFGNWIL